MFNKNLFLSLFLVIFFSSYGLFSADKKTTAAKPAVDTDVLLENISQDKGTPQESPKPELLYTRMDFPSESEDISTIDFSYYDFPYFTGTVFPEAQTAVYSDRFIPLKDFYMICPAGLSKDELIIQVLCKKLEKWGVKTKFIEKAESAPEGAAVLLLNIAGQGTPAPEKSEGYSINCTLKDGRNQIAVNSYDRRGLVWGVVSFLQLVKHDGAVPSMRASEIIDYPATPVRGFLSWKWQHVYEFMLFSKMNSVVMHCPAYQGGWDNWRTPGPSRLFAIRMADISKAFGWDFYMGLSPAASDVKLTVSNPKDIEQIIYVIEKYYASKNINLYWGYDDVRFPVPEEDREKFGSVAAADIYTINTVYREVHKKYPEFKMIFCPPFYWKSGMLKGENGLLSWMKKTARKNAEDGIEYTKKIGMEIDPAIGFYWTGPLVLTGNFDKESLAQVTDWYKRKPWIFKNRPGMHAAHFPMPGDEYQWESKMSYPGFLSDIFALNLNTWGAVMSTMTADSGDYMWNPKSYNAKRSAEISSAMLLGPELYPILLRINEKLSIFDPYAPRGQGPIANADSASKVAVFEEALLDINKNYEQLEKLNCRGIAELTTIGRLREFAAEFIKASKNPKLLEAAAYETLKAVAAKELDFDLKKDIFIPAAAMKCASAAKTPLSGNDSVRYPKFIYAEKAPLNTMSFNFTADPFPPSDDLSLIISAKLFSKKDDLKICIKVNDIVIFEKLSGLNSKDWTLLKLKIPSGIIKKSNNLSVINMETPLPGEENALAVSYMIIKQQ